MDRRRPRTNSLSRFLATLDSACLLCAQPALDGSLCQRCFDHLPWLGDHCQCCALPLSSTHHATELICGECLSKPPAFAATYSPLIYQGDAHLLLHHLKANVDSAVFPLIGRLFAQHLPALPMSLDLLLPVPLHPRRLFWRGFNQAHRIAFELGDRYSITVSHRHLTRNHHQAAQQGKSRRQRLGAMSALFTATALEGKTVALVDDVMTTGATLRAAAKACKRAGADAVYCLVVARTPDHKT